MRPLRTILALVITLFSGLDWTECFLIQSGFTTAFPKRHPAVLIQRAQPPVPSRQTKWLCQVRDGAERKSFLTYLCPLLRLFANTDPTAPRNQALETASTGFASMARLPWGKEVSPLAAGRGTNIALAQSFLRDMNQSSSSVSDGSSLQINQHAQTDAASQLVSCNTVGSCQAGTTNPSVRLRSMPVLPTSKRTCYVS
jgi:hypothetical protein